VADAAHQRPLCHVCIGVYVIDGRAAGAYARVAPRALMDGRAQDAAVLLDASLVSSLEPSHEEGFQHASP
ncbi:MAG: hypothetical protein RIR10_699, partial [Planctomycetota bacterium]